MAAAVLAARDSSSPHNLKLKNSRSSTDKSCCKGALGGGGIPGPARTYFTGLLASCVVGVGG